MAIVISNDTNYWLVRTFGGKYYAEFSQEGYVALGWNSISDLNLIKSAAKNSKDQEKLTEMANKLIAASSDKKGQPGRITSPILRFVNEMKIGDIIIIPSENSDLLNFGKITSGVYIEKDKTVQSEDELKSLYKRRNVEWIKTESKNLLDPYLFRLLNSHLAVSSANDYSHYIDRTMFDFYIKGDNAYLIIEVQKKTKIYGVELADIITTTLGTLDIFNDLTGENFKKNCVEVKSNLNSPGILEFAGDIKTIFAVAFVVAMIIGAKVDLFKVLSFESEGVAGILHKFYKEYNSNKIEKERLSIEKLKLIQAYSNMNAQLPKELVDNEINFDGVAASNESENMPLNLNNRAVKAHKKKKK